MNTTAPAKQIIEEIKLELQQTDDVVVREVTVGNNKYFLLFIDTLIDEIKLKSYVLEPLTQQIDNDLDSILLSKSIEKTVSYHVIIDNLLKGWCALVGDNLTKIRLIDIASTNSRPIQESQSERVITGSHDGFVENIILNIYQIRKRLETKSLTVKYNVKGKYSKSKIAIVYIADLVNTVTLKEVEKRINNIHIDYLQNPGTVMESIEDGPYSPFPKLLSTERPDRVSGSLAEGKIALVLDGSPLVIVLPASFFSFYQSSEDYNTRWYMSSLVRILRLFGFFIAIVLPAFYIALVGIHHELIPTEVIFPLQVTITKVPFPPITEAIIMLLTLELIREVAIRLPVQISVTIGLIGATLIGQAIVAASLFSNMIIVVIAFTTIASFITPSTEMSNTTRLLNLPLIIFAYFFGLLGVTFGLFFILFHLCTLRSFGQPYLEPLAPFRPGEYGDTLIRKPVWTMDKRESGIKSPQKLKKSNTRAWVNYEE